MAGADHGHLNADWLSVRIFKLILVSQNVANPNSELSDARIIVGIG